MPEKGRRLVIVAATPIIALALVDRLDLLAGLYGEVTIPEAVRAEVLRKAGGGAGVTELLGADWIRTVALKAPGRAELLSDLDRGEAEVVALAQELEADLVIIDERLGRRHARRLGLTLTGTMGVLLKAKAAGLIPAVAPLVRRLRSPSVRVKL
jgi:uncharacterized protein